MLYFSVKQKTYFPFIIKFESYHHLQTQNYILFGILCNKIILIHFFFQEVHLWCAVHMTKSLGVRGPTTEQGRDLNPVLQNGGTAMKRLDQHPSIIILINLGCILCNFAQWVMLLPLTTKGLRITPLKIIINLKLDKVFFCNARGLKVKYNQTISRQK